MPAYVTIRNSLRKKKHFQRKQRAAVQKSAVVDNSNLSMQQRGKRHYLVEEKAFTGILQDLSNKTCQVGSNHRDGLDNPHGI